MTTDDVVRDDDGWRRLDRRTIGLTAVRCLGSAVVAGVPATFWVSRALPFWGALGVVLGAAAVFVGAAALIDRVRWTRTRYRVLPDRFELHKGIVVRSRRSLQRERIRTVDITASPLLRLFRVVRVDIGTGEQASGDTSPLLLNPVSRAEAESLRRTLLDRETTGEAVVTDDGTLSTFDLSWVRYAPMSFATPLLGAAAFGLTLQVAEWFGMQTDVVLWALRLLDDLPLVVAILLLVAVGLVIGVIASSALFVEMWWQYRLEREPGGTLRVRRGLLTTRSISVEERRLRGIEVVEPLGNRLAGAARIDAVATGMQRSRDEKADHKTLLPAAPRALASRIGAVVLREAVSPTDAVRLRSHPRAALGRRVRWALLAVAAVVLPLVVLGVTLTSVLTHAAWIAALVLLPVAVALAYEAYRGLGHGLSGDYLVTRHGAVRRTTVALQRSGVIGLTVRQSVFQRRRGLLTITATTAAGSQGYSAYDVAEHDGLAFAEQAVPGLLTPFLERVEN
ncbi:PH domain-containing protein [Saccharomonospora sp. NB11]|jgi:putative membrane protein|uniref:PH domain-containing protein n=1 Tax=Saccharomonospora sp. NB11 TaxID=1642298 RepID=UPI0018D152C9|nr:PH domain-containing protein [Saccharomonospora sp. NB11]